MGAGLSTRAASAPEEPSLQPNGWSSYNGVLQRKGSKGQAVTWELEGAGVCCEYSCSNKNKCSENDVKPKNPMFS